MKILGIETSCDETAAAVVENGTQVLSGVVASSQNLHEETGGIVPEVAAREQIRCIIPVVQETLSRAKLNPKGLDALAVTVGPGLIGSLLVGVETAKALSLVWDKPLVPVNHLIGHIYGNFVTKSQNRQILFPAVVLIVSGGHTDLILMKDHGDFEWLGGTRDDAAGEAFDKVAKMLNLGFPGGPVIQRAAEQGSPVAYNLPRPLIDSSDFGFSFSGLKTAVLRQSKELNPCLLSRFDSEARRAGTATGLERQQISDLASSFQQAVVDVLVQKTARAAQERRVKTVMLAGGVAANQELRQELEAAVQKSLFSALCVQPSLQYCTDNAAMIASAAYFNYQPVPMGQIRADPSLHFD